MITVELLRGHGACEDQVARFANVFSNGAEVTEANVCRAVGAGLDIRWAAERLLSGSARASYVAATAPPGDAYWKAKAAAFAAAWKLDHP